MCCRRASCTVVPLALQTFPRLQLAGAHLLQFLRSPRNKSENAAEQQQQQLRQQAQAPALVPGVFNHLQVC